MDSDLAKSFCAPEDSLRHSLKHPFRMGDYTYFADGFIMIRVPISNLDLGLPEYEGPRDDFFNSVQKLFSVQQGERWVRVKSLDLNGPIQVCGTCDGQKAGFDCFECEGTGTVDLDNQYHTYSAECKSCDGEGKIETCPDCKGTGNDPPNMTRPIRINGIVFMADKLLQISRLPDCEICPTEPMKPGWIRFVGGDGLVMPMHDAGR